MRKVGGLELHPQNTCKKMQLIPAQAIWEAETGGSLAVHWSAGLDCLKSQDKRNCLKQNLEGA